MLLMSSIKSLERLNVNVEIDLSTERPPTSAVAAFSGLIHLRWGYNSTEMTMPGISCLLNCRFPSLGHLVLHVPKLGIEGVVLLHQFLIHHRDIYLLDLYMPVDAMEAFFTPMCQIPRVILGILPSMNVVSRLTGTVSLTIKLFRADPSRGVFWDLLRDICASAPYSTLKEIRIEPRLGGFKWCDGEHSDSAATFVGKLIPYAVKLEKAGLRILDEKGYTFRGAGMH